MTAPGVKVVRGHREGCVGQLPQNLSLSPLFCAGTIERDAKGRKLRKGATGWTYFAFGCNCCPPGTCAEVWIPYFVVTAWAHEVMVKAQGGAR